MKVYIIIRKNIHNKSSRIHEVFLKEDDARNAKQFLDSMTFDQTMGWKFELESHEVSTSAVNIFPGIPPS